MPRGKTHFEQIPVELVKSLAGSQAGADDENPIYESPAAKKEPYATPIVSKSKAVAHREGARDGERNG